MNGMMNNSRAVLKGWGHELVWADTESYCGKLMYFDAGAQFSMHFHATKDESWYVLQGKFELEVIDTKDATISKVILHVGDTWRNKPLVPHRLKCLKEGIVIEVSTKDSVSDNYRVSKGDSQNANS
jgi:mannose-6-phosphate isomerase